MKTDVTPPPIAQQIRVLSDEEAAAIDRYWRAANYLSAGQIYLPNNPESVDPNAAFAIEAFVYAARKYAAAMASALEGVDELVFTGGIGENSSTIRGRICNGLRYLGISIDPDENNGNAEVISTPYSRVTVRVVKTNEALVMARHAARTMAAPAARE